MSNKLKALIVDDEPLARGRLRSLLKSEPEIELIGECSDGEMAVEAIQTHRPDLVFLDVQMPGLDGFAVIRKIGVERMPAVIFTTAFDQYALPAFEVHAIDYLLKPFDRERFHAAVAAVRKRLAGGRSGSGGGNDAVALTGALNAVLAAMREKGAWPDRIAIKGVNRIHLVRLNEVRYIEAAGNYLHLHTGAAEPFVLRETLSNYEARLDPKKFVRIHRSTIVNVDHIKELQPLFHGDYVVLLHNGQRVTLSRGYRDKVALLTQSEL